MRTPFFIGLAHASSRFITGVTVLLASACQDVPSGPSMHPARPPATFGDTVFAQAIVAGQRGLATLQRTRQRTHSTVDDSLLDRRITLLTKRIDGWRQRAASGPSPLLVDAESAEEGIIVNEETWTAVDLTGWGDTPLIAVQTVLSTPALIIGTTTSGSSVVKGISYPVNASFGGFGVYTFNSFKLPEVDCEKAGATVVVSTWHFANWFYGGVSQSTGWKRSNATGSCPRVAPLVHFKLEAQGKYGEDNELFEVSAPPGQVVGVKLTANVQFDAPIKTYTWYRNGVKFAEGPSITLWANQNNIGIRLEAIDSLGLKGTADGVVALKVIDSTTPTKPGEQEGVDPTASGDPVGDDGGNYQPQDPPPPEPTAKYTCYEIQEKMRVTMGSLEWYYWQDMGRECDWVDTYSRLPKGGLLTLPSRFPVRPRPVTLRPIRPPARLQ